MVVGLASFFLMLKVRGFKLREVAALTGVGLVSGILFLLWTHYTDSGQKDAEFAFQDMRLNNPEMVFWYFGDWHYRLNPANWVKAVWRFANVTFGSFQPDRVVRLRLGQPPGACAGKTFFSGGNSDDAHFHAPYFASL